MCSMGCGFALNTRGGEVLSLEYDTSDPVGGGALCSKGNYIPDLLNHHHRLIEPRNSETAISWNDAMQVMTDSLSPLAGKGAVGLIIEGDASLEDVATCRVCAELCLPAGRMAVRFATGDDIVMRALLSVGVAPGGDGGERIKKAETVLAIGDPFELSPVIAGPVLKAKNAARGNTLVALSAEDNRTSRFASINIRGPERDMISGLLRAVVEGGNGDMPSWTSVVRNTLKAPTDRTLMNVARKLRETSAVIVVETQDPVVAQLAAALAAAAPGVTDIRFCTSYGNAADICAGFPADGTVNDILDAVKSGDCTGLIVLGADILRGMPDGDVEALGKRLDFLVAGAPFENETTRRADLVLPTALWCESEGTYQGTLRPAIIEPPGGALPYGEIMRRMVARMASQAQPPGPVPEPEMGSMSDEHISSLLAAAKNPWDGWPVRSSTVRYADGSLTDKSRFMEMVEEMTP